MSGESSPIRVLHVDDDLDFADLTATFLERKNERMSVETTDSVADALGRIGDVDCVVSDFDMPGTNGIEFLERLRDDHPDLPFILFTGKGSEDVASDAIAVGVTDYLQKNPGSGQYTVLANRIENAVEKYRATERAQSLDRIRRVLRDVNQALVRARDREELESRVCEVVSRADPYTFAWIGAPNRDEGRVEPRTSAGEGDGYLDDIEITLDDTDTANGPTTQAIESGELRITQSIPTDPAFEPWRDRAMNRGFRASAAVPIQFEDTTYGVLSVYSDQEHAFSAAEQSLLRELGGDVGHAIHRIESEQQYRQLFEGFPEPTVAVTFDDDVPRIEAVNSAFETVFGYDSSAIIGTSANDLVVPEDREDEAANIDERSRRNDDLDQEVRRQTASGPRDFLLRNIPIPGETGPDLYWVYVDITGRKTRKRQLETLTERLELALEAGLFGVWDWNVETDDVTYDERWASMLGYSLEEIQPELEAWESRVHPEDRPVVEAALAEHFAGETDYYDCDHRMRTKSDEWKWIRDVGKVVEWDEDGSPQRAVGIHQDVTEQKERESALEQERERFAALFESFPASVIAVSYDGDDPIIRDVNSTFEDVFGYTEETAIGRSLNDLIVPAEKQREASTLDRRLQERDLIDEEVVRTAKDGLRDFVLRTITLSDDHDLDTYAVYIDVTERKDRERAMAALHEAATELENANSRGEVYDIVIDAAESVLDFALVAIDVAEDDALVQKAWSIDQNTDGYYSSTPLEEDTLATRAYNRGETIIANDLREYDITPADPEYLSALTVPIGDEGTFQTVSRDVNTFDQTDAELAELLVGHAREAIGRLERAESLRRQRERLRREYDRLDTFVSILSHDLRNPITVAQGRLELAGETMEREHLAVATDALDRMEEMVDDVLTWARQGQHVPQDERRPVELHDLGASCWQNVETSNATLDVETEATILADESRLQHVLENLFRNATEHGSAGDRAVTITVGELPDGFYVEDDGPGIPKADRDDVFSFGYTSDDDGTGFGLTIVKEIVEAHEWEITVTESASGGARFEITGVEFAE
jgi:PAS domain S-box-containing protein